MIADEIRRVAVVGAGLMGHGIAQEFALAGYEVHINDLTEEKLEGALANIRANLDKHTELGWVDRERAKGVPERIYASTVLEEVVRDVDLVIEAVYEDLELKQEIFEALDGSCPEHTILASNTSSLMPSKIAARVRRADKVLVAHYVNPPYLIPLVEIVPSQETSDETVSTVIDVLTRLGKRTVMVQKEVPGFIINRLQLALLREALSIVEGGVASAQDVDAAIKTSIGRRWAVAGIFEVFELARWDLLLAIAEELYPHLEASPEVSPILREKVERGELGVQTGKGFYDWTPEGAAALRERIAHALVEIGRWSQTS
jgi:3-hydroxybutyryl-CoA dehydrogenase